MQADRKAGAALALLALLVLGAAEARAQGADIIQRATGLTNPIGLANAEDGSHRVFIIEQAGRIRIWDGTQVLATPFLDLTSLVLAGGEQGLLGVAFHPSYETNGFFYVNYTCRSTAPACSGGGFGSGDSVLARYQVLAGNPNQADPASARILTVIDDPFSNHNGGQLAFGPDGFLYFSLGDGGSAGDPCEHAQNLLWDFPSTGGSCIPTNRTNRRAFWGKLLRIDVDQNVNTPPFYGIPPGNPYTGANDPADTIPDEIWAHGLRNPWRFSFDRQTGDLYIGDVGQSAWEEVDFQPAGAPGGRNYGWDVLEGGLAGGGNCHEDVPAGSCAAFLNGGSTLPILEYPRSVGFTVIGGYVYRGLVQSATWTGRYVFADWGSGRLWHGFRDGGGNWQMQQVFTGLNGITSFGEDDRGNLYFVRGGATGALFQIYPWSFMDVPPGMAFAPFIQRLHDSGVTAGCTADDFCAGSPTDRAQIAVLALRVADLAFVPPPCGTPMFADVDPASPYCPWIEELARRGITAGCGDGRYCPAAHVTRGQMAVFTLAALEGGGYAPPACAAPMFADLPASDPACRWVEELARRGVVAGCGGGNFCPAQAVTRGEMAVYLVQAFGL